MTFTGLLMLAVVGVSWCVGYSTGAKVASQVQSVTHEFDECL